MTLEQLKAKLKKIIARNYDEEMDHIKADKLLLKYINDEEVSKLFDEINKWYA